MPPLLGTVKSEPGALLKEASQPLQNYSAVNETLLCDAGEQITVLAVSLLNQ